MGEDSGPMDPSQIKYPPELNDWLLGDELGHGAFSTVCKATHKPTRTLRACKVIPRSNLSSSGDRDRFQREINTMAFLRHDNIVSCYDFFSDDNNYYLIIDFCPGGELFQYIVKNDKVPEPLAAYLFHQIASAIAYCHSFGVAHRDLKPENVLIAKFPRLKVSDFGLCGFMNEHEMMRTFCGSPCYCAPECLCRQEYDGRRADVWSLGVILYAMVTGKHPWNITNTSIMLRQILKANYTFPPEVSPKCKDLIQGMMKLDITQRMTVEQILQHPWMTLAEKSKYGFQAGLSIGSMPTPVAPSRSLAQLTADSARENPKNEDGIVSPFIPGAEPHVEEPTQGTALSKSLRSTSVEQFRMQARTRLRSGSAASAAQRSSTNLLGGKKPGRPSGDLTAIHEDEAES
jgi:serine/threonine protein kinase